jgi:hypothetical protein
MDIYKCPKLENENTFPKTILPKISTYVENLLGLYLQKEQKSPYMM